MSYEPEYAPASPGPKASFTVKVDSFDTTTFYDDVVRAAVEQVTGRGWSDSQLVKDIKTATQQKVTARLEAVIDAALADLLAEPIQKFDTFGNAVGAPISVEEIVRNGATTFLTENVDSEGRATRESYGTKYSRLEWLVQRHVIHGLAKEMQAEATKVKAELVSRASAAAAAVLAGVNA